MTTQMNSAVAPNRLMKTIVGNIDGNLVVSELVVLRGMVTGNIIVEQAGSLDLRGICCKNLIIEKGGKAEVHGMVYGDLLNRGGKVTIFGMINGFARDESGQTHIAACAVVQNRRHKA